MTGPSLRRRRLPSGAARAAGARRRTGHDLHARVPDFAGASFCGGRSTGCRAASGAGGKVHGFLDGRSGRDTAERRLRLHPRRAVGLLREPPGRGDCRNGASLAPAAAP